MNIKKENFKSLWEFCASNNRVCPMPIKWSDLYRMFHDVKWVGPGRELSVPLILGARGNTSDNEKQERFKIHIKRAEDYEQIDEDSEYLRSLKETD